MQARESAKTCHPHKGLQLPSLCVRWEWVGEERPSPFSSTNRKPVSQRDRLSSSKDFQCFLPAKAALCQLTVDRAAWEPWLLLASFVSQAAPSWRQHAECPGANGHHTSQHLPALLSLPWHLAPPKHNYWVLFLQLPQKSASGGSSIHTGTGCVDLAPKNISKIRKQEQ